MLAVILMVLSNHLMRLVVGHDSASLHIVFSPYVKLCFEGVIAIPWPADKFVNPMCYWMNIVVPFLVWQVTHVWLSTAVWGFILYTVSAGYWMGIFASFLNWRVGTGDKENLEYDSGLLPIPTDAKDDMGFAVSLDTHTPMWAGLMQSFRWFALKGPRNTVVVWRVCKTVQRDPWIRNLQMVANSWRACRMMKHRLGFKANVLMACIAHESPVQLVLDVADEPQYDLQHLEFHRSCLAATPDTETTPGVLYLCSKGQFVAGEVKTVTVAIDARPVARFLWLRRQAAGPQNTSLFCNPWPPGLTEWGMRVFRVCRFNASLLSAIGKYGTGLATMESPLCIPRGLHCSASDWSFTGPQTMPLHNWSSACIDLVLRVAKDGIVSPVEEEGAWAYRPDTGLWGEAE